MEVQQPEINVSEETRSTTNGEWIFRELCAYKCKKKKTMNKHMQPQHMIFEICANVTTKKMDTKALKEHMNK